MLLLGSGGQVREFFAPPPDRILSTRKKEEQRGKVNRISSFILCAFQHIPSAFQVML